MSEWINFKEIVFSDESIKQVHVDTRDFHCSYSKTEVSLGQYVEKMVYSGGIEKTIM